MYLPKNSIYPRVYINYIFRMYSRNMEHKKKNPFFVPYKTYSALIRRFHEKQIDRIIYNQHEFVMPHNLGNLRVIKKKPNIYFDENGNIDHERSKMKIDFQATRKYNKKMYYYNNHTKGYYMKFNWVKKGAAYFKNAKSYRLKISHPNRRKLNEAIHKYYVKGKIDFYKMDK